MLITGLVDRGRMSIEVDSVLSMSLVVLFLFSFLLKYSIASDIETIMTPTPTIGATITATLEPE